MRRLTPLLAVAAAVLAVWLLNRANRAPDPPPAADDLTAPAKPAAFDADGWAAFRDQHPHGPEHAVAVFLFYAHSAGRLPEAVAAVDPRLRERAFREGVMLCERSTLPAAERFGPPHAALTAARRRDAPDDPRPDYHDAVRLMHEKNYAAAEPLLAAAAGRLGEKHDDDDVKRRLTTCRVALGWWREVYAAEGPACFENVAWELLRGKLARNRAALEELIALALAADPGFEPARRYRMELAFERKDYAAAIAQADALLAGPRDGNTDWIADTKFRGLVRLDRWADAKAVADTAALDPGGLFRRQWRAILAARDGDAAAVLRHLGDGSGVGAGSMIVWTDADLAPRLRTPAMAPVRAKFPPPITAH